MLAHVARSLDFDSWANARVGAALAELAALEGAGRADAEPLRLFAHVVRTETIYLDRMRGRDPWPQDFWPVLDLAAARDESVRIAADLHAFLAPMSADDLERRASYRTSKGAPHTNTIDELFAHLMAHGVHHRGQLATLLRQRGATPPVLDLIAFLRERPA